MASKSYDKEWKIARVTLLIAIILFAVPTILLFIPNIIDQGNIPVLMVLSFTFFGGLLLLVTNLVYFLVLRIFIAQDKKRVAKLSDKLVPKPGLSIRQRLAVTTVAFAGSSLIFFIIYLIGNNPADGSSMDYRFTSFSVLAGYAAIVLTALTVFFLIITVILYIVYFSKKKT